MQQFLFNGDQMNEGQIAWTDKLKERKFRLEMKGGNI